MEIWLKQGKEAFRLPINPASYQKESEQDNKTEIVNAFGEVNLLGKPKLDTLPLSAHFPKKATYYDQYTGYDTPINCVKTIEKMKKNGVIRLVMTGTGINTEATIERFTWGEQDGTKDIYYTIEIKKYRRPKTSTKKRSTKVTKTVTVTVKKGDTWAKLAKKFTGSSKNAKRIAKENKMANKKEPPVGKKVVINP